MRVAIPSLRDKVVVAHALLRRRALAFRYPLVALTAICLVEACHGVTGPLEVSGGAASYSIASGQEIDVTLQTAGDGEYLVPPTLSGTSVAFLGMASPAGKNPPGGVRQVFRFRGVAGGQTVILFHNSNLSPDVSDTVIVR